MKVLLLVLRTSPAVVVLAFAAALLSGLCSGGLIAFVNSALTRQETNLDEMGWKFLGLVVLTLISAVAANVIIAYFYRKVLLDLQLKLARRITQLPLRDLEEIGSAPLLAVLTDDVAKIGDIATAIVPLITNAVTTAVCFGYLFWLSPPAFFGTVTFFLLGGVSYKFLTSREQRILEAGRDHLDNVYRYFHDLTHGLKELKLNHTRGELFLGRVLGPAAAVVQKQLFLWDVVFAAITTWGRFLILVVIGLVLFLLPRFVALQPAVLSGYVLALLYVRSSLLSVLDALPHLSAATVALRKIESFGLNGGQSETEPERLPPLSGGKAVKLGGITHRYFHEREDSVFTLGPVNFKWEPGEIVFLVGGNGSGKTTLAKVIMGLYPPESGEISVGNCAIGEGNRASYRQLFSAVFTDFHLFEGFPGLEVTSLEAQAKRYLEKLDLAHRVSIQDGKLSTTRALSRGQQQRLALLVAYLEDRPFYVFDEWAANQDPVFKELFYTQLVPELKARGKGVLVISHDDRYFHLGDRVLKLADGKLVSDTPSPSQLAAAPV